MDTTDSKSKVSQNRQKKEALIEEYTQKVSHAKGLVFANYQGLTHQQLENLKKAIRPMQAELIVAKNTLLLRALGDKVTDETKPHFEQPTAALFLGEDVIEPLKELAKLIKEFGLPALKFGIIDGKNVSGDDIIKLSKLPPLPVLQAQLLGQMMSPIQGLHRALRWNLQNFVITLKAIENKKQAAS